MPAIEAEENEPSAPQSLAELKLEGIMAVSKKDLLLAVAFPLLLACLGILVAGQPVQAAPAHTVPAAAAFLPAQAVTVTGQIDIVGPAGSGKFGTPIMLPNGNFVVVDPLWDNGGTADIGAVYLYNGTTLAQISRPTGSTADDQIGSGGVAVLPSGNFVVVSPLWDNGGVADAGAVPGWTAPPG